MPSVTMDRQMLTIQMRKYSPAWPVNLRETKSLAADCAASDGCATSPPGFLSPASRMEREAQHRRSPPQAQGILELGYIRKAMSRPRSCRGLKRRESNPISARVTSGRQAMSTAATKETLGFQAEVKQLLNLMIHSLY